MKISIDLDGTFYAHPEFFAAMALAMQAVGHRVGVLTGHNDSSEAHDREKLTASGFVPDFYLGRTPAYQPLNGSIFKRDMIREHGIDVHFDDHDYSNPTSIALIAEYQDVADRVFVSPHKEREARW